MNHSFISNDLFCNTQRQDSVARIANSKAMDTSNVVTIRENEFCRLRGCETTDIPLNCARKLRGVQLAYRPPTPQERDRYLLHILRRIDEVQRREIPLNYKTFENGWEENYAQCVSEGVSWNALRPRYIKSLPFMRYLGDLIVPEVTYLGDELFSIILTYSFEKYLGGVDHIYEFGCGTGRYLWMLAHLFSEKVLIGLDWTKASLKILALMRQKGLPIEGSQFDMLNPDAGVKIRPNSAVITMSALEQLGNRFEPFLSYLLDSRPELVLHHEPIEEFYDGNKLLDYLAIAYHRRRGYLSGY